MLSSVVSEPGNPAVPNQDWVAATANVAVVLDGLSEGPETGCIHGTSWLVRHLGARLLELADDGDMPLRTALAEAITAVAGLHRDTCDLTHPGSPCSTVAILRERPAVFDYLVLSDSAVVIETHDDDVLAVTDTSVHNVAVVEAAAAAAVDFDSPEHLVRYRAMIAAQQQVRNTPGGYWVAQTDPAAAEHAAVGTVPAGDVRSGLVLSDGATRVVTELNQWTWQQLVDYVHENGPTALIRYTRDLERDEAVSRQWRRYKISDDAAIAHCTPTRAMP